MAKKVIGPNSINIRLFSAIKICDKANLPLLILSNPGFSKSSTVFMYSEIAGRTLIQLRSNSTTHEEVVGYDTVPQNVTGEDDGSPRAAVHLRPSWFQKLLDADARGEKCLLFLDEITTAHSSVQSALLHLIFERKCGDEPIPESTLIISAGNYMSNLSRDLSGLMAPTMNRFVIYNLRFEVSDLDCFLGHYTGAMIGQRIDYMAELKKALEEIDKQELDIPEDRELRIMELLEGGIKDQTRMLMCQGDKPLDINEPDLESIYEDIEDTGGKVLGFITPRGLYYATKLSYAAYKCFGKPGLQSEVFRSLLEGIIGLAIKRDPKTKDIKKKNVAGDYFNFLQQVANDIEKMKNNKLPEYEKFFIDITTDFDKSGNKKRKDKFQLSDIQAMINKFDELGRDKEIENIERPIPSELLDAVCDITKNTSMGICNIKLSATDKVSKCITSENLISMIVEWNSVSKLMSSIVKLVDSGNMNYRDEIKISVKNSIDKMKNVGYKLRQIRMMSTQDEDITMDLVPKVESISSK